MQWDCLVCILNVLPDQNKHHHRVRKVLYMGNNTAKYSAASPPRRAKENALSALALRRVRQKEPPPLVRERRQAVREPRCAAVDGQVVQGAGTRPKRRRSYATCLPRRRADPPHVASVGRPTPEAVTRAASASRADQNCNRGAIEATLHPPPSCQRPERRRHGAPLASNPRR